MAKIIRGTALAVMALALWSQAARPAPPEIGKMLITGAGHLKRGTVVELVGIKPGERLERDSLATGIDRLLDRYRADGFLLARADVFRSARTDRGIDLTIAISEGRASRLRELDLDGNDAYPDGVLLELADLKSGERLYSGKLRGSIGSIEGFYLRSGYADVRVEPGDFDLDPAGDLRFGLEIDEGPRYSIGVMKYGELKHATSGLIQRVSGLRPGMIYDPRSLPKARLRLLRSGYFSEVDAIRTEPRSSDGLMDLQFRLREGPGGSFGGLVGYQPEGQGAGGGFIGQVDLKLNNVAGSGRFGSVYWQRLTGSSGVLQLEAGDPYLLGRDIGLLAGLNQVVEDSLYLRREVTIQSQLFKRGPLSLILAYRASWDWPDRSAEVEAGSARNVGAGLILDSRDRSFDPRRGVRLYGLTELGRRRSGTTGLRDGRFTGDLDVYRSFGRRTTLHSGLHLRRSLYQGDKTPLPDRFLLGGNRTIRGYRESQFRAWEAIWLNLEGRVELSDRAAWAPFIDLGRLRPESPGYNLAAGYGMGLRLRTASGTIGIDYALSGGRSIGRGLVHLRLQEEF